MTTYTDIQALKARCTALETKDKALSAAATALTARVAKLEAVNPVDYAPQIAALQKEVDALRYIISSSARRRALAATASSFRLASVSGVLLKSGTPGNYYNALTDGVCHGDGVTDDVNHILAAITAYKAAGKTGLYFPAANYYLASTLAVPANTVLLGAGTATTRLLGTVNYGSGCTYSGYTVVPQGAVFNVETYGATHTGIHDDAPHIRSAVQACAAAGGGIVYFPAGSYFLEAGYDSPNGSCKGHIYLMSNVTLQGAGVGQTILNAQHTGDTGRSAIIAVSESNIGVNNLSITSPLSFLSATNKDGYKTMGCSNVTIHDTYVENVYLASNCSGCTNITYTDCYHYNCKVPFSVGIATNADGSPQGGEYYMSVSGITYTRCEATLASDDGRKFGFFVAIDDATHNANPTKTISNVTLNDCYSHNNPFAGGYFRHTDRTTIINSRFINNGESAVRFGYCTNYWMASNTATGNTDNSLPTNDFGAPNTTRGSL